MLQELQKSKIEASVDNETGECDEKDDERAIGVRAGGRGSVIF